MALTAVMLGLLLMFLALEAVLRLLPVFEPFETQPVTSQSPYRHLRPDNDATYSTGWNFAIVNRAHVNNYGFVNDQDYVTADGQPLLAVIGDSYVEALMVPYEQTLQGRLAELLRGSARVYSFGTSGCALSDYLAYAQYVRDTFRPSALVVSIVGNDFDESLLEYKREAGYHYFRKADDGSLTLTLIPYDPPGWKRWVAMSAVARYLYVNLSLPKVLARLRASGDEQYVGNVAARADAERVENSLAAIDRFLELLPAQSGLQPADITLLVDGMRPDLYDAAALQAAAHSYFATMRAELMQRATAAGYTIVDMQPRFIERHARDGARFEWDFDAHWNGDGHAAAAQAVAATGAYSRLQQAAVQ